MERVYQLTKINKGDYMFPSNDGTLLLRVDRYYEDGSASWTDTTKDPPVEKKIVGYFWRAGRYRGTLEEAQARIDSLRNDDDAFDFLTWEDWVETDGLMLTREEAIQSALKIRKPS